MSALPARSSLLAVGLALCAVGTASAAPADGVCTSGSSLAAEGLRLVERVLHVQVKQDEVLSYAISVGPREASLELDLASGRSRTVAFRAGEILMDGQVSGRYAVGGPLDRGWRQLLASSASLDTRGVLVALRAWDVPGLSGDELAAKHRIDELLREVASRVPSLPAAAPAPPVPAAEPAPAAAPEPEVEVPAEAQAPPAAQNAFQILFRDVRNVVAVFIALAMIGFGTVFFARRNVEVVADTAANAFGRSLVVGLLGQLLLLPTLAMLIVGLVFTIVGILLLPFAVIAYVIAACVAALGGYLAVAHAIGETVSRRRMANGVFVRYPNAYGYLFTGLIGLLGLWAAAALFGWAGPVVFVFRAAAFIVTWLAATVGFGAVLLSRAGLRETFAGRHAGELSDEYLWATPPATPAAPRPGRQEGRRE
jgi:predicted anti-sigma-YlaC factor YlaD